MVALTDPFATPQDMSDRTEGEITATTHPFLERELAAASRAIREACGWHIAKRETVKVVRLGRYVEPVFLPASQIVSIESVKVNGVARDIETVEFDPMTGETNLRERSYAIEFVAGYEEFPADLVAMTLELAAAGLGAALGLTREQAGSVVIGYRSPTIGGDQDRARLAPYALGYIP